MGGQTAKGNPLNGEKINGMQKMFWAWGEIKSILPILMVCALLIADQ